MRSPALPALGALLALAPLSAPAETRIDLNRPDAPALAGPGERPVGVRRIEVTDDERVDALALDADGERPDPLPRAPRTMVMEVFHPAAEGASGETAMEALLRDGETVVTLRGRSMSDAGAPYPAPPESHTVSERLGWAPHLDLIPASDEGVSSMGEDGTRTADHPYWERFSERTAKAMRFEARDAGD